jgi:hypothetical protein
MEESVLLHLEKLKIEVVNNYTTIHLLRITQKNLEVPLFQSAAVSDADRMGPKRI